MKKNNLFYVLLGVTIWSVCTLFACSKASERSEHRESVQRKQSDPVTVSSISTIPLVFKDVDGSFKSVSYAQLQNLYNNSGILPTRNNDLTSADLIEGIDDNGNEIIGIRTTWHSAEGTYYSIASIIHVAVDANGGSINVLSDNASTMGTSTCSCEGACSNGCEVSASGGSFCSCTPCFPSGNCMKKHTVITVTPRGLY